MATKNEWVNADGLIVNFGPVISGPLEVLGQHTKGNTKEIQLEVDIAKGYPTVGTKPTKREHYIPKGAFIQSARFISTTAFDVAVEIGTMDKDAATIDKDGLLKTSTTQGVVGALVGTVVAQDSYISIEDTGGTAPTSGKGTLIVEYIIVA